MSRSHESKIILGLDDTPGRKQCFLFSFQWLAFVMAQTAVIPVVIGPIIGLDSVGIATLAQRLFFVTGLASLLQIYFGHRLPVTEGASALSWAVFISLAQLASVLGHSLPLLRTDFTGGLLAAGILLFILGISGAIDRMMKLFTPVITGCMMILLSLQVSPLFMRSMLGITPQDDTISLTAALTSVVVIITMILVSFRGGSFMRSISVLFGLMAGWLLYYALESGSLPPLGQVPLIDVPRPFAWGLPTFGVGIVMTNVIIGLILMANTIASVAAMGMTLQLQDKLGTRTYSRATTVNGAANILAAVGSSVGMVPHATSAGLVSLTGVASRKPFILYSLLMMGLGFFPPLGLLVATIPAPVGYAVYMIVFAQIIILGLRDLLRLPLDLRDSFVVGLTILLGVGIMALPAKALSELPLFLQYIAGSGLTMGILICLILEHIMLPRRSPR